MVGSGDEEVPNPELRGEKEEKQEIGPVDSLEIKDEEEDETSLVKTPADGDGGGQTGGQFSDRSGDRSSDRSPRNKRVERTKSSRSLVSRNVEETREETSRCKQVDFYRAIDRSGPVRGPVRDRSNDGSPLIPSYNEEEDRGNECSKNQKYYQVEEEIRRQVDSYRAIDRSGPVRGPVRDRSSERSPLFPSQNGGESLENECGGNQKYHQLEEEFRRQVDFYRAIDRSGPVRGPVRDRSSDRSPLDLSYSEGGCRGFDYIVNQKYNPLKDEFQRQVDSYRAIDRFGPVRGPVWDRSKDRSPINPSFNAREGQENDCRANQKYNHSNNEVKRQVNSYRVIDRFGPVRGPVCDRSKDRSSVYSTSNTEEYCENPYKGEQENKQEGTVGLSKIVGDRFTDPDRSHDRSIWNRSDDRAINRSHDRANDRSLKKSILYLNERSRRDEDEQVEESHDRSIWKPVR